MSTKTSVFLLHPSKKCPLHIKSLSGVPEEPRGVPCPRITGTAPRVVMRGHESLLPEGIHQRKWERNPQLIHSTSPHSISTLESVQLWKRGTEQIIIHYNRIVGHTLERERIRMWTEIMPPCNSHRYWVRIWMLRFLHVVMLKFWYTPDPVHVRVPDNVSPWHGLETQGQDIKLAAIVHILLHTLQNICMKK